MYTIFYIFLNVPREYKIKNRYIHEYNLKTQLYFYLSHSS